MVKDISTSKNSSKRYILFALLIVFVATALAGFYYFQNRINYDQGFSDTKDSKNTLEFMPSDALFAVNFASEKRSVGMFKDEISEDYELFKGVSIADMFEAFRRETLKNISIVTVGDEEKTDTIIAAKIYDASKAKEIGDKLTKDNGFFVNIGDEFFVASTDDVILQETLSRKSEESMFNSEFWKDNFAKPSELSIAVWPNKMNKNVPVDVLIAQIITDSGKLVIEGNITGNNEEIDKLGFKLDYKPNVKFSLFKAVPIDNLVAMWEFDDLSKTLTTIEDAIKKSNPDLESKIQAQKDYLKLTADIDYDSDILPLVSEGGLIALHDNPNSDIPYFTILFGVRATEVKAERFFDELNSMMKIWMNISPEFSGKVKHRDLAVESKFLWAFDFDPGSPADEFNITTLSYGVTTDKLILISSYPDAQKEFKRGRFSSDVSYNISSGQDLIWLKLNNFADVFEFNSVLFATDPDEYDVEVDGELK